MATYLELKAQAEKLMAEAERVRQQEIDDAIADIKNKMQLYGITARDLGLTVATARGRRASAARGAREAAPQPKYRGPNGETWSGGRGRKPGWVVKALEQGRSLDEFAV